jgi:uncharacterized protein
MIKTSIAWRNAAVAVALSWLACGWLAGAMPAAAQQQPTPAAVATAKELLAAKNATAMFDPIIPGVVQSTMNTFLPTNPNLFKELNEVAGRLRNELAPRRNEIVDEIAKLYAQRFSEAEMKEVINFYKSPIGKKFVNEEPAIIDQGLQRAEAWSRKMSEEVLNRFRAEMKKKGYDL